MPGCPADALAAPPLTDAPGCLRRLADRVEAGSLNPQTIVVVWDDPERIVAGACFGQLPDRFRLAGLLKVAADKASTGAWA